MYIGTRYYVLLNEQSNEILPKANTCQVKFLSFKFNLYTIPQTTRKKEREYKKYYIGVKCSWFREVANFSLAVQIFC